jgi:hypothetical protein
VRPVHSKLCSVGIESFGELIITGWYGPVRTLIHAGTSRLDGHRSEGTYARNRNLPTYRCPSYKETPITPKLAWVEVETVRPRDCVHSDPKRSTGPATLFDVTKDHPPSNSSLPIAQVYTRNVTLAHLTPSLTLRLFGNCRPEV